MSLSARVSHSHSPRALSLRGEGIRLLLAAFLCSGMAYAHEGTHGQEGHGAKPGPAPVLAPGYEDLAYPAPEPGTYRLPPLGRAAGGSVIDSNGHRLDLAELLRDRVVLLSFIYTHCDDVNGCPLATFVQSVVQNRLRGEAGLAEHVRFISLSFDPDNDTPAVMAEYGRRFAKPGFDWRFLTTSSDAELAPILAAYDQSIRRDTDAEGKPVGTISHILRVYLIDRHGVIRNIYSTSFLHPDTVVNDIRTLLMEEGIEVGHAPQGDDREQGSAHRIADDRAGYEDPDYQSSTRGLETRRGKAQDLLRFAREPGLGLPPVPVPAENPLTEEKVQLGRKLFYDRRLSHNNTFSCAMCHVPDQGFTSNELATAVGVEGRTGRRNAPTLYNVAYFQRLFHDARETSLEQQVWGPLLAHNEMANPSVGFVVEKIRSLPDYAGLFEAAFDGRPAGMETIGMALASYQRVLTSANSPFDRWYYGHEEGAMPAAAVRGFTLFQGKARCNGCHTIGPDYALFTDGRLHNIGTGYLRSMGLEGGKRVLVAPGTWLEVDPEVARELGAAGENDLGYYEISGNPADRWKFRTPGLRNVALTAPYMHDGSLATLRDVIKFYNVGGVPNELLDPLMGPLGLNEREIDDLVAFLEALTGDSVDALVSDAFAAPVGNVGGEAQANLR